MITINNIDRSTDSINNACLTLLTEVKTEFNKYLAMLLDRHQGPISYNFKYYSPTTNWKAVFKREADGLDSFHEVMKKNIRKFVAQHVFKDGELLLDLSKVEIVVKYNLEEEDPRRRASVTFTLPTLPIIKLSTKENEND